MKTNEKFNELGNLLNPHILHSFEAMNFHSILIFMKLINWGYLIRHYTIICKKISMEDCHCEQILLQSNLFD